MKFLGWMHKKIRQNSIDPLKEFTIGNYCTCLSAPVHDEQECHANPYFGSAYGSRSINHPREEHEASFRQEPPTETPELFHGFLAIGTLGISEPATPTFTVSLDDITEKITEVTADELKLINDELEKFLEAESEEEGCKGTSRNSYVSTITLCSKQTEAAQGEGQGNPVVCPLQGYLFSSSVELPETTEEKKDRNASLGQIFQETKQAGANRTHLKKSESEEVKAKSVHKSSKSLVKKILKKLGASSRSPDASFGGEDNNTVLRKKSFQKVLQKFQRKIHPENPIATKECKMSQGYKSNHILGENIHSNGDSIGPDDGRNFTPGIWSKGRFRTNLKCPYPKPVRNSSDESMGHWIKTDADYLVLEL